MSSSSLMKQRAKEKVLTFVEVGQPGLAFLILDDLECVGSKARVVHSLNDESSRRKRRHKHLEKCVPRLLWTN